MHILPSLHDSFGGSVNVCMKELLFFFGFGFKRLVVQELKGTEVSGDGEVKTQVGWKNRKCAHTSICVILLVVLSVFFSLKELLVCVDLSSPWCRS